jgi:hypothetical protein
MEENMSDVKINLTLNQDYLCAACSCGVAMLVPLQRAVVDGLISCDCGTEMTVDSATVEHLRTKEKSRLSSHGNQH